MSKPAILYSIAESGRAAMGNANTHERRKSGVPETGLTIEDIRAPATLFQPDQAREPLEHVAPDATAGDTAAAAAKKKTPPPSFETTGTIR